MKKHDGGLQGTRDSGECEMAPLQNLGLSLFCVPMVICSMEMVPGWGMLGLRWPNSTFFIIMSLFGFVAGACMAPDHRNRIPGAIGGAIAGFGALFATSLMLDNVSWTSNIVILLVAGIGILPGLGVYWLLSLLSGSKPDDGASKRPW